MLKQKKSTKITDVLKKYNFKKALMESTLERIRAYQEVLRNDNIQVLGLFAKKYIEPGMPRAYNITSPVEAEIFGKVQEQELTKELVEEWIAQEYDILWMMRLELSQIDAALRCLTRQERSIVEWRYLDNLNWKCIEISYEEQYKEPLIQDSLKKYNTIAIQKITNILRPFYDKFKILAQ